MAFTPNVQGSRVIGSLSGITSISSVILSASTYIGLPTDIRVTGGTYSSGIATFINNTGGTFTVTGFSTGTSSTDTYVTGGTYSNGTATFTNNSGGTFTVSGFKTNDIFVTGSTYSNNEFIFTNNTGGTFNVLFNTVTGLTSTGLINASTISATTYQNLPIDINVTGGTYLNGDILFTNNTGGTFTVSGLYTGYTTPIDVRVTGGTYSNGTAVFTNNTGGTFNVSGFKNDDTFVTGGTYSNGDILFTNNTGGTFNVSGLYTGYTAPIDVFTTGGTYNDSTGVATFTNNSGGTFNVNGFFKTSDDIYTTGITFNPSTYDLSIGRNDNTSFTQNLAILATDMTITGGTYNGSTGVATFTNNTGGTFNVSGFLTGMTDTYTTGFTYSDNTLTIQRNAGQPDLSVLIDTMTGLTVNGIISATTYQNLPIDINVTGGTYSNGNILFTNNTGGTFNVTGLYTGYTAPIDVYTTGATYSNNTFTYTNNTGGTFNVLFNTLTGLTVNGSILTTTISATTYQNLPSLSNLYLPLSGGTVTGGTIFNSGLTANTIYTNYIDFNTGATVVNQVGRLSWDDGNGTLALPLKGGNVNLQIGQENVVLAYNAEATPLLDGEVVYVFSSQGNRPSIKRAVATSDGYSVTTLGVVTETIASGAEGFVTTFGMVNNLNTIGFTGGTALWLSPTIAGAFTSVKPQAPYHTVLLGYVVRVHASVGSIFVHISNGWELDELHDVRINGKQTGDLISLSAYNGSNVWVNTKTLNGSYTITGDTTIGGNLSTTTISATTYYNLPTDVRVTGATYSNNTFTYTNNTGGTFSTLFNTMTGLTITGNLTVTGGTSSLFSGNSSSDLVRITQIGTGNAFVVEDSTNPDTSPFVINNIGNVGIGTTTPISYLDINLNSSLLDGETLPHGIRIGIADGGFQNLLIGADASNNISYLQSLAYADYIDGQLSLNPRGGKVGIGIYNNLNAQLHIQNTTTENSFLVEDSTNPDSSPFVINNAGNVGVGVGAPTTKLDVSGDTKISGGLTATTVSATTYLNLPTDIRVTGGTYSNSTGVATFTNNTGGTFNVNGFFKPTDDIYTTGMTFNNGTYNLSIGRNDGTSFSQSLAILASDMTVTGGTYNGSTGVATFTNNSGGTFSVSGFLTGMTDTYTTGVTFNNNTLTIQRNAGQPDINTLINNFSGLTVTGTISATTISATTYQNLPPDLWTQSGTSIYYNTGNVGIGESNPTRKFEVLDGTGLAYFNLTGTSGPAAVVLTTDFTKLTRFIASDGTNSISVGMRTSGETANPGFGGQNDAFIYVNTAANGLNIINAQNTGVNSDYIRLYAGLIPTQGISHLHVQGSGSTKGFIGINTENPTERLHVSGNTLISGNLSATTISATTYLNLPPDLWTQSGTSIYYNTGNVGIGTSSPVNTLQIHGNPTASIRLQETGSGGNKRLDLSIDASAVARISANQSAQSIAFDTVNSERIRITSTGNVGIGTTVPSEKLHVSGNTLISGNLSATTISATTYLNLPTDIRVTGGTHSSGTTIFRNNTGGTFTVSGFSTGNTTLYLYAESSTIPSVGPIVNGTNSIALGGDAQALANDMFVYGQYAGNGTTGATYSNLIGYYAGRQSTDIISSNFIGFQAGYGATNSSYSNFYGYLAGYQASGSTNSNLIGYEAGRQSSGNTTSNFFGLRAGYLTSGSTNSNFIGNNAGREASNSIQSNFIGTSAGYGANSSQYSNFIGNLAGSFATGSSYSNFIGVQAGYLANDSTNSNFIGWLAGQGANNFTSTNFIGNAAGYLASASTNSNFIGFESGRQSSGNTTSNFFGYRAGYQAINSPNGLFMGSTAGYLASGSSQSNFIGNNAGRETLNSIQSNFIGTSAGYLASGSQYSNFTGHLAGYQATGSSYSNFIGYYAGYQANDSTTSNFIGWVAGQGANNFTNSNFIGNAAGYLTSGSSQSNFIGFETGRQSSGNTTSNFFGYRAGYQAINNSSGLFIGSTAGYGATGATSSNFIGNQAGYLVNSSSFSNFFGYQAGYSATSTSYSNFIGFQAGRDTTGVTYSNLFGYYAGESFAGNNIGSNNIIIGTNISLPNATTNSINIGGVLFGTNTYSTTTGNPSIIPTSTGRIGIGIVTPSERLHVSGNTLITGNLNVSGNTNVRGLTGTSATISGTGQNILTVIGSGNSTSSPLFSVQGSSGELFSVTDSLTGSLFSVNDISGLPIVEVFSDNTMLVGSYQAPALNTTVKTILTAGTNTIYSIPTSAYTGAFIDYTVINSVNTSARAGNIMTIWNTGSTQYTEVSTNDIGSTTGITFSTSLSGSNALISASATTAGWTLKTIIRAI